MAAPQDPGLVDVEVHRSFCRTCQNWCAVQVETREGRVVRVRGDHDDPLYHGYTCNKGRAHGDLYTHPDRLTTSLVQNAAGEHVPISSDEAIEAIARQLTRILEEHGPRAISFYSGSYLYLDHPANLTMQDAFMRALGTRMNFTTASIDQSGKPVAIALHGLWMAPFCGAQEPDATLLVGNNPLVSHLGFPGNPGDFVRDINERCNARRHRSSSHRDRSPRHGAPAGSSRQRRGTGGRHAPRHFR